MFEEVLIEQNPHWGEVLYPEGIKRTVFGTLLKFLASPHIISVTGVRRAGKSTLLKQLINSLIEESGVAPSNILFINLEHPYFAQYSDDVKYLERLFEDYRKIAQPEGKIYCLLDEIQFFSNWPVFVKAHYEMGNVKFVITGSNSFLLSHELLTLLSGRTLPIEVYPLSLAELILAKTKIKKLDLLSISRHRPQIRGLLEDYLQFGGFPDVALSPNFEIAYDILTAYSKSILYQDVATRIGLKKSHDLEKLFYYLTSHIGTAFSYAGLAKIFDLTDKTIKEYLQACIEANLLFEVDHFSYSLKQQVRAPKKVYSIDPGLVNAVAFKFSENRGRLFENSVFLELKRWGAEVYTYKTAQNYEIDFIVKQGATLSILQVCADLSQKEVLNREIRAILHAAKELKLTKGIIITADEEQDHHLDGIDINILPLYKYILTSFPYC